MYVEDTSINLIYKVTVDGQEMYVDSDAQASAPTTDIVDLDDIGLTGHVRVVSGGTTIGVLSSARSITDIVDGAEYTSNAYTRVTVTNLSSSAATSGSNIYNTTTALTSGNGVVVSAGSSWLLEKGAVLTVTVTPIGSTSAAETIEGVPGTAGVTSTAAQFGTGETAAQTFTLTVTVDGDATATTRTITITDTTV